MCETAVAVASKSLSRQLLNLAMHEVRAHIDEQNQMSSQRRGG